MVLIGKRRFRLSNKVDLKSMASPNLNLQSNLYSTSINLPHQNSTLNPNLHPNLYRNLNPNLNLKPNLQYSPKVLGHFALSVFCNELSSPSPPETMLVFWRSTCDYGKISRARQLQVSHKRTNIVLGERGAFL